MIVKNNKSALIKRVQPRYITIDEPIFQNLSLYEMAVYQVLRFEADYAKECSQVEMTVKCLVTKSRVSRRKVFDVLNALEDTHFLLKRLNYEHFRYGQKNIYHVAREYLYFKQLDKSQTTGAPEDTGVQSQTTGAPHAPKGAPHAPVGAREDIPKVFNNSIKNSFSVCVQDTTRALHIDVSKSKNSTHTQKDSLTLLEGQGQSQSQSQSQKLVNGDGSIAVAQDRGAYQAQSDFEIEKHNAINDDRNVALYNSKFARKKDLSIDILYDIAINTLKMSGRSLGVARFYNFISTQYSHLYQDIVEPDQSSSVLEGVKSQESKENRNYQEYVKEFNHAHDFLKIVKEGEKLYSYAEWLENGQPEKPVLKSVSENEGRKIFEAFKAAMTNNAMTNK